MTANPPFGKADLTNCERELIHLAASIQPQGILLTLIQGPTGATAERHQVQRHNYDQKCHYPLEAHPPSLGEKNSYIPYTPNKFHLFFISRLTLIYMFFLALFCKKFPQNH